MTCPQSVPMLDRALGATYVVVLVVAAASAASELPTDFKETMDRRMVSEDAERPPLSVRAPEASVDLLAPAAAFAEVLDRSGEGRRGGRVAL